MTLCARFILKIFITDFPYGLGIIDSDIIMELRIKMIL